MIQSGYYYFIKYHQGGLKRYRTLNPLLCVCLPPKYNKLFGAFKKYDIKCDKYWHQSSFSTWTIQQRIYDEKVRESHDTRDLSLDSVTILADHVGDCNKFTIPDIKKNIK